MNVNVSDLIMFFVQRNPGVGRIAIVKFLYLADLEARKYFGEPLTKLTWIWYDHGPFDKAILATLDQMSSVSVSVSTFPWKDNVKYEYKPLTHEAPPLPPEAEMIAAHVWGKIHQKCLDELLNDIVYQSKPMLDAKERDARNQPLRMDLVDNEERQELPIDPVEAWRGWRDSQEGRTVSLRDVVKELRGTL